MKTVVSQPHVLQLFVRRDFVATCKRTIPGPLRYLIQPLPTALMFTVIFARVARLPIDGLPPFLFSMAGTVIWKQVLYFFGVDAIFQQDPQRQGAEICATG